MRSVSFPVMEAIRSDKAAVSTFTLPSVHRADSVHCVLIKNGGVCAHLRSTSPPTSQCTASWVNKLINNLQLII